MVSVRKVHSTLFSQTRRFRLDVALFALQGKAHVCTSLFMCGIIRPKGSICRGRYEDGLNAGALRHLERAGDGKSEGARPMIEAGYRALALAETRWASSPPMQEATLTMYRRGGPG